MPGSIDLDTTGYAPLVQPAAAIAVCWYTAPEGGEGAGSYELVPNVRCLRIDNREGPEPPAARFEYVQSQLAEEVLGWPSQFEQLWPLDADGDYVVLSDDRIVVLMSNPDGSTEVLFDGFAQVPQADVSGHGQRVTFAAVGVAARCSDDVIHTRIQRDSDTPQDTTGHSDVEIEAPCRFNPTGTRSNGTIGILGNSTPDNLYTVSNSDDDPTGYPVFVDPLLLEREERTGTQLVDEWYVGDALLYLTADVNDNPGDPYISWPDPEDLVNLLATLVPSSAGVVTAASPTANCVIRDYDASNKPLPAVLHDLLGYAGFYYAWQTEGDADGNPQTYMNIYRTDAAATGTPKALYLAPDGYPLDPTANNASILHLARDSSRIVNAWGVDGMPQQVEVTVLLAPLFRPSASDAQPSTSATGGWNAFKSSNLADASSTTRRKYRWFGADECGDGHLDASTGLWESGPAASLDLSSIFPSPGEDVPGYCTRYRPGKDRLLSVDDAGTPRRATLEVSFAGWGGDPALATQGGDAGASGWYQVTRGWRLLDDRLGIEVTIEDPEQWHTGHPDPAAHTIRAISWLANPDDESSRPFRLRLTTAIDADVGLAADQPRRSASPTQFSRWRRADAHDHFQKQVVTAGSRFYAGTDGQPTSPRDDTTHARDHARQLQAAHEFPPLAGSVTIPYITTYYAVGNRIGSIDGRDVALQTNVNASGGEAPTYPWIVGVSWDFSGDRQSTILQLSDHRAEAHDDA